MHNMKTASFHAGQQQHVVFWDDLRRERLIPEITEESNAIAWDRDAAYNELFGDIPFDDEGAARALFDVLVIHTRGHFDEAYTAAEKLMGHKDPIIALAARTVHLQSALVLGHVNDAYHDSMVLRDVCGFGLTQREDERLYGSSVICGMHLELTLGASLFNLPSIEGLVEVIPPRICAYFGYVLALREIMLGNYELAMGIAYLLQILVGSYMHNARCYLYIVYAKSFTALGDARAATEAFQKAWLIRQQRGVISPFIEAGSEYYGLHRAWIKEQEPEEYLKLEALANNYRKSKNELCKKSGVVYPSSSLSSLECCVWTLVLLGWRNKEIAAFIKVTENTVKHQLTSIYQKLGVRNRQELRECLRC